MMIDGGRVTDINPIDAWILAARPKTLPAAVAPVMVGSAMAAVHNSFALLPALAALAVALLLQIGVNLANDYFDFIKGVDSDDRLGPLRVTQSGLIPPARVRAAMSIALGLAGLPGLYLVYVGGWPVLVIGVASILAALAYSGGPFPLASNALGDLFVFIFFGLVAVCGTYYVQTLKLTATVVLIGADVGLLITAILVVNNLRDIATDRKSGKRTLAVRLGVSGTKLEFSLLLAGAYCGPLVFWIGGIFSVWVLLPFISVPLAWRLIRTIRRTSDGPRLNHTLASTAKLALLFSLLLAIGIIA
jgi:1,4-dihydroxy-2-naphthoate octaprenyltransferase